MTDQYSISFQADGSPYSQHFDDIYFDTDDGYQQSEAVFIGGNELAQNFAQLSNDSNLTIAETGFGTGLNFLLTLKHLFLQFNSAEISSLPSITYISTEKFPLTKAELEKSLAILPQLSTYSALLLSKYPKEVTDDIELSFFEGKITLKLLYGDATESFSKLAPAKHQRTSTGFIDVWYLDGFSPSRNPEMWSDALFEQIARLSKEQASLSTFTVAGFVKRGLTKVGFRLAKREIDCKKEHCLAGLFQSPKTSSKGYQLRESITKPQHVAMIGGGIASACAAYLLTQNGIKVTLYCKDSGVAQGASSNAIGALFPLLHQQKDDISEFYEQAFWRARALYTELADKGFEFAHQWCGLLEISYKESLQARQNKFEQLQTWPESLVKSINAEQASNFANIKLPFGGLFMPSAGWIAPQELVKQLFKAAETTGRLRIKPNIKINKISQVQRKHRDKNSESSAERNNWEIHSDQGVFKESVVVLAGGADAIKLDMLNQLPLTSTRGQVTSMRTNDDIGPLNTVICHKGYLTPKHNNIHCIGATFEKDSTNIEATSEDDEFNLNMLNKCLPNLVAWNKADIATSKARLRCMTPDHLPIVGPMPNIEAHKRSYAHLSKDKNWRYNQLPDVVPNMYVMTGFGARGLCTAPLAADILLADLCGTPYPVNNKRLFSLAANRFVIRDITRRQFD